MDVVHDQLATGKKICVLTVVDTFSRYVPVLYPRFSYRAEDVVRALEQVCPKIGYPKTIRVDQGHEFVSRDLDLWAYAQRSDARLQQAGRAHRQRLHRSLRRSLQGGSHPALLFNSVQVCLTGRIMSTYSASSFRGTILRRRTQGALQSTREGERQISMPSGAPCNTSAARSRSDPIIRRYRWDGLRSQWLRQLDPILLRHGVVCASTSEWAGSVHSIRPCLPHHAAEQQPRRAT